MIVAVSQSPSPIWQASSPPPRLLAREGHFLNDKISNTNNFFGKSIRCYFFKFLTNPFAVDDGHSCRSIGHRRRIHSLGRLVLGPGPKLLLLRLLEPYLSRINFTKEVFLRERSVVAHSPLLDLLPHLLSHRPRDVHPEPPLRVLVQGERLRRVLLQGAQPREQRHLARTEEPRQPLPQQVEPVLPQPGAGQVQARGAGGGVVAGQDEAQADRGEVAQGEGV